MNLVILTAAGIGSRMGQDIPKQFMHIENKPLIVYTMEAFQNHPSIDKIVVVTLENWMEVVRAYASQYDITKLANIVVGGVSGQESIFNGLQAIANMKDVKDEDVVMVHDGNRCLVSSEIISDSLATYAKYGSAVAAIPTVEAVFVSDNGFSSKESIDRTKLLRTQTPHTYSVGALLEAHSKAKELGIKNSVASATLMQELGNNVYFSKGSEENIKITTVEDISIFKAFLNARKEDWLK